MSDRNPNPELAPTRPFAVTTRPRGQLSEAILDPDRRSPLAPDAHRSLTYAPHYPVTGPLGVLRL